jgi:hypothetical protein
MAALPKTVEEIVSGVLVGFEFSHFMWALLMEVVSMFYDIYLLRTTLWYNAVNYPSTPLSSAEYCTK